jgi:aryl-alcohol dehydrogenase-like predicted oxidoreductase
MRAVPLGTSGLLVSRIGLGCNSFGGRLDLEATRPVVEAALDAGITHFDTADIYGHDGGSERCLGRILGKRRDRVVLATKFGGGPDPAGRIARGSRAYVRRAVEGSLERLRTDYIDLYYYHRPDGVTPIAETLGALAELVREGKVRHAGCSNLSVALLRLALAGPVALTAAQNQYSLLSRSAEEELIPLCREHGLGFVPWAPLARGALTGKYRRGEPPPDGARLRGRKLPDGGVFDRLERLERFAAGRGRTLLELAIAAVASRPGVSSVIAGATSPEQVRANVAAGEWEPSQADLDELAAL